jgi:hypothetical protein
MKIRHDEKKPFRRRFMEAKLLFITMLNKMSRLAA